MLLDFKTDFLKQFQNRVQKASLILALFLGICSLPHLALAATNPDGGLGVFAELNNTKFESKSVSFDSRFGFGVGLTYQKLLTGNVFLRTGAGYIQKNSTIPLFNQDLSLSYLEIPATLLLEITPNLAGFAGLNIDVNLANQCSVNGNTCIVGSPNRVVTNAVFGGRFRTTDKVAVELLYETGLSDVYSNVKIGSSFVGRLIYLFK